MSTTNIKDVDNLKKHTELTGLKKIVQAGMSVGIASGQLAGAVMAQNAVGNFQN